MVRGISAPPTNFAVGITPRSIAVGDFNADGKQDLVTANGQSRDVSILLGDGAGNFTATNLAVGNAFSVAVGEFNADGNQDLAVTWGSDNVAILLGDGTGNFSAPTNFAVGITPRSIAVGDFNGDGMQDLAVPNGGILSILLRDCEAMQTVSQITPAVTTCSQFSSGTAETLGSVQYDVNNGLIHRVAPRAFLYWVPVAASAGRNIFTITQTITTHNFDTIFAAVGNGSNVLDSDCVPLQRTITQSGDTVTVRFNAPVAGTYYISPKFNSQNLSGEPAPNGTTVHYEFTTTGVPDSTTGLDLIRY